MNSERRPQPLRRRGGLLWSTMLCWMRTERPAAATDAGMGRAEPQQSGPCALALIRLAGVPRIRMAPRATNLCTLFCEFSRFYDCFCSILLYLERRLELVILNET